MRKHALLITSLFLLGLATVLNGQSDDQPRWNTTLFGVFAFGDGVHSGIGGALGYSFAPPLELEGEVYIISTEDRMCYGVSGVLLYNIVLSDNKSFTYLLGGFSMLGAIRGRGGPDAFLMLGGGFKFAIKENLKIRFDLRWHPAEDGWMRLTTGLMWTFD